MYRYKIKPTHAHLHTQIPTYRPPTHTLTQIWRNIYTNTHIHMIPWIYNRNWSDHDIGRGRWADCQGEGPGTVRVWGSRQNDLHPRATSGMQSAVWFYRLFIYSFYLICALCISVRIRMSSVSHKHVYQHTDNTKKQHRILSRTMICHPCFFWLSAHYEVCSGIPLGVISP